MSPRISLNQKKLAAFFREKSERPLRFREIAKQLHINRSEYRTLKRLLRNMIRSGDIIKTKSGLYGLVEKMDLVTGIFEAHRDGFGFVIPEKSGIRDIFIPARRIMGAMSGDRVVARIENPVRRDGSIIKILERACQRITGEIYLDRKHCYVLPRRKNIPYSFLISPANRGKASAGDHVLIEITSYPTAYSLPEGRVIKVLPDVEEPNQEIDLIIDEFSLRRRFPSSVLEEARQLKGTVRMTKKRVDCRDLITVTIDGESAKDFDDAISIEKNGDGYRLFVHIADVSHYVDWDSALDIEARRRGTSVYFPGSVIPMLPERLSNDLCSLVPGKDRPAFTVEMYFNRKGDIIHRDFYQSMINSNERMTYTIVKNMLVDNEKIEKYEYLLDTFRIMEELCNILRKRRIKRGSLDFDLPEPEVLLDLQGRPESILKSERNIAHMMIEEFMIAANETVASYLESQDIPCIFRVHEKPDPAKLEELKIIFKALGINIQKSGVAAFNSILKKVKGLPEESILNVLLLRSLKQALYSEKNIGHFGLASECYCHFTSPIRRYPDLIVHRMLKFAIEKKKLQTKKLNEYEKLMQDIATHSSRTERVADEAEREIVNAMRAWFMKDRIGEEFEGVVSGISSKGLRVQLKEIFVEGFLHVSSLDDDYYRFEEKNYFLKGRRTKRKFRLGQPITVRVERVNIREREIMFGLAGDFDS